MTTKQLASVFCCFPHGKSEDGTIFSLYVTGLGLNILANQFTVSWCKFVLCDVVVQDEQSSSSSSHHHLAPQRLQPRTASTYFCQMYSDSCSFPRTICICRCKSALRRSSLYTSCCRRLFISFSSWSWRIARSASRSTALHCRRLRLHNY